MKLFYLNKNTFFFLLFFLIIENAHAQISFAPPSTAFTTIAGGTRRMKAADFNKDGIQDVVATTSNATGNKLSVSLGTYTGVMSASPIPANLYPLPSILGATATADFDADGDLDVAVVGSNNPANSALYILKNNNPIP